MPVTLLPISNTISFVSATIPPELVVSPAISYWIYVEDENLAQESIHFNIGVMMPEKADASIELDAQTSKREGTTLRSSAYVNTNSNAFGKVSLFVNDVEAASKSLLLVEGQTKVDLDWYIPKEGKQMTYDLRAEVDLYGDSISTDITKLNTFPRTQLIPISEMKPISPLSDEVGNVIAQPASVYASDRYYENLRFQVTTEDGFCFIGPSENCAVQESTSSERGGIKSVEYNGKIYRIDYSGQYSSLERFSITTVDQIPSKLAIILVPLEKQIDEFVPPAFAAEDIDLKVKYRAISEIVTVKST